MNQTFLDLINGTKVGFRSDLGNKMLSHHRVRPHIISTAGLQGSTAGLQGKGSARDKT